MIKQEEFDDRRADAAGTAPEQAEWAAMGFAHEFGNRVRAARESRGWSVPGLARRATVMCAEITAIESGVPMPAAVAGRVAATVGVEFGHS